MKKNFLSCFFLAAFLWGQTAPVMAMPQGDYSAVDQETRYTSRLGFCQKHKKAIIGIGTVAVGIGIGIASALGVFSGEITNSSSVMPSQAKYYDDLEGSGLVLEGYDPEDYGYLEDSGYSGYARLSSDYKPFSMGILLWFCKTLFSL
jgi:hypothetical protein